MTNATQLVAMQIGNLTIQNAALQEQLSMSQEREAALQKTIDDLKTTSKE